MGQFKPMVKMMTTEPSVELKLKKGGKVEKKMQMGGALAAQPAAGLPARGGMLPAAAPMRPSMAARRRAMMAGPTGAAPAAPVGMAGRMMKEGGETSSEHKAEMKKFSKLEGELKSHEGKPASKAHKGLKTGGVVNGQGGFATGGVAKSNAGGYKKGGVTKMAQGGRPRSVPFDPDSPSGRTSMKGVPLPGGGRYINPTGASTEVKVPPPDPGTQISPPEVKVPPPDPGTQIRPPQRDVGFIPPRRYATGGVAKANAGGYASGGPAFMFGGKQRTRPLFRQPTQQVTPTSRPSEQVEIPRQSFEQVKIPRQSFEQVEIPPPMPAEKVNIPPPRPIPGGYKKGGAAKKAYATGGLVDTGRPVAMPQGAKKPSTPVSINQLSGTFKKGGKVTAAQGRLQKISDKENASAMKSAKAYSNEVYSKYGQRMKEGGKPDVPPKGVEDTIQTARNERAYKAWEKSQAEDNKSMANSVGDFLTSIPGKIKSIFSPEKAASAPGSVTKTEKSVTVTPKKRGGAVTC